MRRLICAIVLLATAAPAAAQTGGALPGMASLKRDVVVTGELVRIGDLVENAGTVADTPIFRAPDLGNTGSVPADRVLQALRQHGLTGVDTGNASAVTVTRASRAINAREIEGAIARALAAQTGQGDAKSFTIRIDREVRTMHVEPSVTGELRVAHASFDARGGRFDVAFDLPSAARRAPLRFTGTAVQMVEILLPVRTLARGDVLRAADLAIERRPRGEVAGDAVGSLDQAVGLAARRPLQAGAAMRSSDLMKPELVQRDESVTLVYQVPGILLTMRGKALVAGSDGDQITVLNVQSKRTVQGTVSGPGQVTVAAAVPRIVASAGAALATVQPASSAE